MPTLHKDIGELVDSNGNPLKKGFYLDKEGLLVFVTCPNPLLVEAEQEGNFFPVDNRELTPIPASDLEKLARKYAKIGCAYKAAWVRNYIQAQTPPHC